MKKITLIIGILVAANLLYGQHHKEQRRERAEVKIEAYKQRLNLTENQLAELKDLREAMRPELEKLRRDPALSRPDKMRAHADLLDERMARLDQILNAEQLAELEVIRKEVMEKRAERREKRMERREGRTH